MRRLLLGLAIAASMGICPLGALANDDQVAKAIVSKLQAQKEAGRLKDFQLGVKVEDGVAILDGYVPSADQQTVALEVVRRVRGVKMVVNGIQVQASEARPQTAVEPISLETSEASSSNEAAAATNEEPELDVLPTGLDTELAPPTSVLSPRRAVAQPAVHSQPVPRPAPTPQRTAAYRGNQTPVAFAPSQTLTPHGVRPVANLQPVAQGGPAPIPTHMGNPGMGVAPAQYDHPQLPNYAWPSYAAAPNYAAVTYPRQYSPTAWPYIGPFYPYPQVPLGWRKVTLEWDDGWWMLDFKNRRHR